MSGRLQSTNSDPWIAGKLGKNRNFVVFFLKANTFIIFLGYSRQLQGPGIHKNKHLNSLFYGFLIPCKFLLLCENRNRLLLATVCANVFGK